MPKVRGPKVVGSASGAAVLLAAALAGGCSSINSNLNVAPGQQFVLGGGQAGGFTVDATNVGEGPVNLELRRPDGTATALGTLAPGARDSITFPPGAAAVVVNQSADTTARVRVRITGSTDLGMRYEETGG